MAYESILVDVAEEQLAAYKKAGSHLVSKIEKLRADIEAHPYEGIGKPEPLKHEYSGFYSRRISREHRLVYKVDEEKQIVYITSLHGHY